MGMVRWLVVFFAVTGTFSCGRYGPPHPPEELAPKTVSDLSAKPLAQSLMISWQSPEKDIRGKELKSLEGYRVMRCNEKEMRKDEPLERSLTEIALVEDRNLEERNRLREEAREKGEIARRVKVPPEKKYFSYEDKDLVFDQTYLYRVIPLNQGGVKGTPSSIIKVLFKGEDSDIFIASNEENLEEGIPENPFGPDNEQGQASGLFKVGR